MHCHRDVLSKIYHANSQELFIKNISLGKIAANSDEPKILPFCKGSEQEECGLVLKVLSAQLFRFEIRYDGWGHVKQRIRVEPQHFLWVPYTNSISRVRFEGKGLGKLLKKS